MRDIRMKTCQSRVKGFLLEFSVNFYNCFRKNVSLDTTKYKGREERGNEVGHWNISEQLIEPTWKLIDPSWIK